MTLSPGNRLGPYEIMAAIGAGGMGEVFRARDTKLGREVAIKVLPAAMAHDSERVARFRREAQILATLNHPNIAAIHGLEETPAASGQPAVVALVMDLVGGEDLAERLKRGAIPVDEARHQVSIDGGVEPLWSRDGRELFFQQGARLMGVGVTPGPALSTGAPRLVHEGRFLQSRTGPTSFSITPDGSRFLRVQRVEPERATTRIDLVQNWFEEVKAKAASRSAG